MAHTCPDCGQACYCSGDCEDHDTGGEFEEECVHYLRCENTMEDDGGWEPEGWEERWVVIEGFERYEVSTLGRIRVIATGHIVGAKASGYNGYVMNGLATDDGPRTMRRHVLVAKAFVPNPDGKTQIDHLDGDRLNNAASNLEWVTPKENRKRAVERGTSGAATNPNFRFKLSPDDVEQIRKRLAAGENQELIGKDYGVNNATISRIKRGVAWKHSHKPTAKIAPEDLREQCARLVESYARGCVTNHICARIAADIRALDTLLSSKQDSGTGAK